MLGIFLGCSLDCFPFLFIKIGSQSNPEFTDMASLTCQLALGISCLPLRLELQVGHHTHAAFTWDLHSDPHACMAITLCGGISSSHPYRDSFLLKKSFLIGSKQVALCCVAVSSEVKHSLLEDRGRLIKLRKPI